MVLSLPEKAVKIVPHFSCLPDLGSQITGGFDSGNLVTPTSSAPQERIAQLVPCLIHREPFCARGIRSGV